MNYRTSCGDDVRLNDASPLELREKTQSDEEEAALGCCHIIKSKQQKLATDLSIKLSPN